MTSAHSQRYTCYLRVPPNGEYAAIPVVIPPGLPWTEHMESVGPIVLIGTQCGYRATTSDLHEAGESLIRDGNRLVVLAQGIERGSTEGPADWLELGADSYRSAA